jgi:hypothetical protein
MDIQKMLSIFSYIVATSVGIMGIAVTAGLLMPKYIPDNFRVILGIIFILYSIFRIVTLRMSQKQKEITDEN